jgi:hypothetical protein
MNSGNSVGQMLNFGSGHLELGVTKYHLQTIIMGFADIFSVVPPDSHHIYKIGILIKKGSDAVCIPCILCFGKAGGYFLG